MQRALGIVQSTRTESLIRIEQGTLPATAGTQHYISSGANSSLDLPLSTDSWPWQPNQTYYLRIVNSEATPQSVTVNVDGTETDTDGDGLPDTWEMQYFGNTNAYTGASDPDGDGRTNLFEYITGTNPTDPSSRFTLREIPTTVPGSVQIVFDPILPGRTYTVQTTPDLKTPNWTSLTGTTQSDKRYDSHCYRSKR